MSDLSVAEFVDEIVTEIEVRLEGHLTASEDAQLRESLTTAIHRLEHSDA